MTITARNYVAQALDGLQKFYDALPGTRGEAKEFGKVLLRYMESSIHFAVPDSGYIMQDDLRGIRCRKIRLPYPVITVEWFEPHDPSRLLPGHIPVDKRILLAIDGENEIYVYPFFHFRGGNWESGLYGMVLDTKSWANGPPSYVNNIYEKLPNGATGLHLPIKYIYHSGLEDLAEEKLANPFDGSGNSPLILEFLEALSCSNVRHEPIEPVDQRKNARRIKAGKLPIYETRILTIDAGKSISAGSGQGGSHASPRQHLRRGHIRRLQDKNVWVNACVVGRAETGVIDKQYHVSAA